MELHWQSLHNNYIVKATVIHANRQGYMGMEVCPLQQTFHRPSLGWHAPSHA